jgi:uncharacterized protein
MKKNIYALLVGMLFSTALVKGEVISWFRIQEMFMFKSFHMYGIIGSAIAVGALSLFLIRRFNLKTIDGKPVVLGDKVLKPKANFRGGVLFGLGWAMTGSCPGPLYAHLGYGHTIMLIGIVFAILGVYVYGIIRNKLPH